MTWSNSNFTEHYRRIRIEGFGLDKLISKCNQKGIALRNLRKTGELEMELSVSFGDYPKLKALTRSNYRITILQSGGYRYLVGEVWRRKMTIVGVLLALAFLYYQSLFIVEIRIDGYETLGEEELRQTMRQAGLYEGARKNLNVEKLKIKLYETYEELTWISVKFTGRLAEVKVAEGGKRVPMKVKKGKPCDIVADRSGYIHSVTPKEGIRAVKKGAYVKKGQVLIKGTIPLYNMAYGTDTADLKEIYVHAAGTVKAKVPRRLHFFGERYERHKTKTGRGIWGLSINGHDSAKAMNRYQASTLTTRNLFRIVKPFPLRVDLTRIEEVNLRQKERNPKEFRRTVEAAVRTYVKEKLPKGTEIRNQTMHFTEEKNIIAVGVTLETLQKIGKEREIKIDKKPKGMNRTHPAKTKTH